MNQFSLKFTLLLDLGIVVVPEDYRHENALKLLERSYRGKFSAYDKDISDEHFPNPSHILKPGEKLWVRIFRQAVPGSISSGECLDFLAGIQSHNTGSQGAALVFAEKRATLPKGRWCCSFDVKQRLWKSDNSYHRVPVLDVRMNGDVNFRLGLFEERWNIHNALLSFCDVPVLSP